MTKPSESILEPLGLSLERGDCWDSYSIELALRNTVAYLDEREEQLHPIARADLSRPKWAPTAEKFAHQAPTSSPGDDCAECHLISAGCKRAAHAEAERDTLLARVEELANIREHLFALGEKYEESQARIQQLESDLTRSEARLKEENARLSGEHRYEVEGLQAECDRLRTLAIHKVAVVEAARPVSEMHSISYHPTMKALRDALSALDRTEAPSPPESPDSSVEAPTRGECMRCDSIGCPSCDPARYFPAK